MEKLIEQYIVWVEELEKNNMNLKKSYDVLFKDYERLEGFVRKYHEQFSGLRKLTYESHSIINHLCNETESFFACKDVDAIKKVVV